MNFVRWIAEYFARAYILFCAHQYSGRNYIDSSTTNTCENSIEAKNVETIGPVAVVMVLCISGTHVKNTNMSLPPTSTINQSLESSKSILQSMRSLSELSQITLPNSIGELRYWLQSATIQIEHLQSAKMVWSLCHTIINGYMDDLASENVLYAPPVHLYTFVNVYVSLGHWTSPINGKNTNRFLIVANMHLMHQILIGCNWRENQIE